MLLAALFVLLVWFFFDSTDTNLSVESRVPETSTVSGGQSEEAQNLDTSSSVGRSPAGGVLEEVASNIMIRVRTKAPVPKRFYPTDDYLALKDIAASGDATGAYLLALLLTDCVGEPFKQTEKDFEGSIDEIYQTNSVEVMFNGERKVAQIDRSSPKSLELLVAMKRRKYTVCNKISPEDRDESSAWLSKAIEGGAGFDALLELGRRQGWSTEAGETYMKAWKSGDPRALNRLATLNGMRYRNWEDPTANVKEAAYHLAFLSVMQRLEDSDRPTQAPSYDLNLVQRISYGLHAHELEAAKELAVEIVNENPECCYKVF